MIDIRELSFVKDNEGSGRNFWSVDHSGDIGEHWRRGELMALEALNLMAGQDDDGFFRGHLLGFVALDMARMDAGNRIKLGFMNCMGQFATIAREDHGDGFFRQYLTNADAAFDAALASEKAKRSEQGRKAAQARWAKRDLERLAGEARS